MFRSATIANIKRRSTFVRGKNWQKSPVISNQYASFHTETKQHLPTNLSKTTTIKPSSYPSFLKEVAPAVRQYFLMRFLQFPKTAKIFAETATNMIKKGGIQQQVAEAVVGPLTKAFSAGPTVPEAVKNAQDFLLTTQKELLLDYTEEMLNKAEEREAVFHEIDKLLSTVAGTLLSYIPIKITGLISYDFLEKLTRDEILNSSEEQLFKIEKARLFRLVEKAERLGKIIFIDQEYPTQKQAIFKLAVELMQRYNTVRPVIYITIQATDRECFDLVKQLSVNKNIRFPAVKLVNGAYVDWAHKNAYGKMMQPSKMNSFIAFLLIAKFCLRKNIYLYMGTHNVILEQLVDDFAQALPRKKDRYLKGQLYGFTTKENVATMYAIFGPTPSCIHYSLRRVIEGAGSSTAAKTPLLPSAEIATMIKTANLDETLSPEEITLVAKAAQFNVQQARVDSARTNLYKTISFSPR